MVHRRQLYRGLPGFFNPEVFAGWVNWVFRQEVLPTNQNYMPKWIPLVLVWA